MDKLQTANVHDSTSQNLWDKGIKKKKQLIVELMICFGLGHRFITKASEKKVIINTLVTSISF